MTYNKLLYSIYLFCITIIVCASNGELNRYSFVSHNLHLILLSLFIIYAIFSDFNFFSKAILATKYVGIFVVLMLIGILRSNVPGIASSQILVNFFSVLLYYLSTCYIIKRLLEKNEIKNILNLILIPFLFFAILNIGFYFMGFTNPVVIAKDSSKMMQLIGFSNFSRINFYFVTGVNSYGSVNGALLVITILSFIFNVHNRVFIIFATTIFAITIFFTDCRGALGSAVIAIAVSLFINKSKKLGLLNLIPYFGILAPLIFVSILPLLASSTYFSFLARGGNDLATGNSRLTMWEYILNDFIYNNDILPFGFGDYGLYKTDAYLHIAHMFKSVKSDLVINPQNSLIAIILDYGFLAVILFTIILFSGTRKMKNAWTQNKALLSILASMLIYLLLIGITEAFIGLYYNDAYVVFIFIFCLMTLIPKRALIDVAISY